ncbi:hypothetical protein ACFWIW_13885 [Amycolatopsis sp. NPDC058340]|uniref:hypothetical protein n=1 Tax=Amycolatopsis sp. NPDC058340 TaxID=3346453 RepID=UPI00365DB11E
MGNVTPAPVFALLFMVLLGAIPRRYRYLRLPAVIGWIVVWIDGVLTGHWTDTLGVAITAFALLWPFMTAGHGRTGKSEGRRPTHRSQRTPPQLSGSRQVRQGTQPEECSGNRGIPGER